MESTGVSRTNNGASVLSPPSQPKFLKPGVGDDSVSFYDLSVVGNKTEKPQPQRQRAPHHKSITMYNIVGGKNKLSRRNSIGMYSKVASIVGDVSCKDRHNKEPEVKEENSCFTSQTTEIFSIDALDHNGDFGSQFLDIPSGHNGYLKHQEDKPQNELRFRRRASMSHVTSNNSDMTNNDSSNNKCHIQESSISRTIPCLHKDGEKPPHPRRRKSRVSFNVDERNLKEFNNQNKGLLPCGKIPRISRSASEKFISSRKDDSVSMGTGLSKSMHNLGSVTNCQQQGYKNAEWTQNTKPKVSSMDILFSNKNGHSRSTSPTTNQTIDEENHNGDFGSQFQVILNGRNSYFQHQEDKPQNQRRSHRRASMSHFTSNNSGMTDNGNSSNKFHIQETSISSNIACLHKDGDKPPQPQRRRSRRSSMIHVSLNTDEDKLTGINNQDKLPCGKVVLPRLSRSTSEKFVQSRTGNCASKGTGLSKSMHNLGSVTNGQQQSYKNAEWTQNDKPKIVSANLLSLLDNKEQQLPSSTSNKANMENDTATHGTDEDEDEDEESSHQNIPTQPEVFLQLQFGDMTSSASPTGGGCDIKSYRRPGSSRPEQKNSGDAISAGMRRSRRHSLFM